MRAIKDVSPVAGVSLNKLGIITENKETGERKRNSIGIMQNIRRFPLRRSMRERFRVFAEARTLAKEALTYESNPVDEARQRRHRGPISRRRGLPNRFSIVRLAAGTRSGENVHASLRQARRIETRGGRAWTYTKCTRNVRQRLSVTRARNRARLSMIQRHEEKREARVPRLDGWVIIAAYITYRPNIAE